jgi:sulfite reductase beta subunit-like hemoprotein
MLRNARQQVLTQLGFESNDYVMTTPNTGTKNDPFRIPTDPAQQKTMYTFLGSTIGKLQDPQAMVHLRMPNGSIQQFTPTQLRALNQ